MKNVDALIIGGGPAGIAAAEVLGSNDFSVLLVDEGEALGGQLLKQTHKFFGSKEHYAGTRGIDIPEKFSLKNVEVMGNSTVLGIYNDGIATVVDQKGTYSKVNPQGIIVATGAQEKFIAFPGNDLPGVYGAGAVQTLMNTEGILPGKKVIMIGAGNIGIIVSYQLLQAGVDVVAVLEADSKIGGYLVHASKIARAGVPILTSHTILKAIGEKVVTGAEIAQIDEDWNVVPGTRRTVDVDTICLAVGLSPVNDLLLHRDCKMDYIEELGGLVPRRNDLLETSIPNVFVAGDVAGVEEASSAMVEGKIAGLGLAKKLGRKNLDKEIDVALKNLAVLRSGEVGKKVTNGLIKIGGESIVDR